MKRYILLALLVVCNYSLLPAQEKQVDKIKDMIENRPYVFTAQTAMPLRGRVIQLTSGYRLLVSKDTLIADLPYYGRAYVAPIDPSEGGIKFTSVNFEYKVASRKKGGWNVTIKPKDAKDVQQMMLSVSESGYASLQVISRSRQGISYRGIITQK